MEKAIRLLFLLPLRAAMQLRLKIQLLLSTLKRKPLLIAVRLPPLLNLQVKTASPIATQVKPRLSLVVAPLDLQRSPLPTRPLPKKVLHPQLHRQAPTTAIPQQTILPLLSSLPLAMLPVKKLLVLQNRLQAMALPTLNTLVRKRLPVTVLSMKALALLAPKFSLWMTVPIPFRPMRLRKPRTQLGLLPMTVQRVTLLLITLNLRLMLAMLLATVLLLRTLALLIPKLSSRMTAPLRFKPMLLQVMLTMYLVAVLPITLSLLLTLRTFLTAVLPRCTAYRQ